MKKKIISSMLFLAISNSVLGVESSLIPSKHGIEELISSMLSLVISNNVSGVESSLIPSKHGMEEEESKEPIHQKKNTIHDDTQQRALATEENKQEKDLWRDWKESKQQLQYEMNFEDHFYEKMFDFDLKDFAKHCRDDWEIILNMAYATGFPKEFNKFSEANKINFIVKNPQVISWVLWFVNRIPVSLMGFTMRQYSKDNRFAQYIKDFGGLFPGCMKNKLQEVLTSKAALSHIMMAVCREIFGELNGQGSVETPIENAMKNKLEKIRHESGQSHKNDSNLNIDTFYKHFAKTEFLVVFFSGPQDKGGKCSSSGKWTSLVKIAFRSKKLFKDKSEEINFNNRFEELEKWENVLTEKGGGSNDLCVVIQRTNELIEELRKKNRQLYDNDQHGAEWGVELSAGEMTQHRCYHINHNKSIVVKKYVQKAFELFDHPPLITLCRGKGDSHELEALLYDCNYKIDEFLNVFYDRLCQYHIYTMALTLHQRDQICDINAPKKKINILKCLKRNAENIRDIVIPRGGSEKILDFSITEFKKEVVKLKNSIIDFAEGSFLPKEYAGWDKENRWSWIKTKPYLSLMYEFFIKMTLAKLISFNQNLYSKNGDKGSNKKLISISPDKINQIMLMMDNEKFLIKFMKLVMPDVHTVGGSDEFSPEVWTRWKNVSRRVLKTINPTIGPDTTLLRYTTDYEFLQNPSDKLFYFDTTKTQLKEYTRMFCNQRWATLFFQRSQDAQSEQGDIMWSQLMKDILKAKFDNQSFEEMAWGKKLLLSINESVRKMALEKNNNDANWSHVENQSKIQENKVEHFITVCRNYTNYRDNVKQWIISDDDNSWGWAKKNGEEDKTSIVFTKEAVEQISRLYEKTINAPVISVTNWSLKGQGHESPDCVRHAVGQFMVGLSFDNQGFHDLEGFAKEIRDQFAISGFREKMIKE